MKSCVVYAASIFDSSRMNVIREFFSSFKENFGDVDFYIGVNHGSVSNLEKVIDEYKLNCNFIRGIEPLYTKTDASAYQAALKLLKQSGKTYDIYWFAHTKGGVNSRENVRELYIKEFFSKRQEIEDMFTKYPQLGSWGLRGNSISAAGVQWKDYNVDCGLSICGNKSYSWMPYRHVNWSYIETLYVLNKTSVEEFLKQSPDEFFTTKLNPWYFETVMPWVPSRMGFFPYVKIKRDFWDKCELTDITKQWLFENGLDLHPYLNI